MNENKTPEYVKKSVNKYRDKHDIIQLTLEKGLKDRLKAAGISTADIRELIMNELEKRENNAGELPF